MRWVGFVRNVMLGREGLSRDVLIGLVEEAGGADVRSHLTTGNVTFDAPDGATVVPAVEAGLRAVLGRSEPVVLRDLPWLLDLVRTSVFDPYDDRDWELEVGLLPHDAPALDRDRLADPGRTVLLDVRAHEVLTARPRAGGSRPHVVPLLERATGGRATARGWSTLQRIAVAGS